jgi:hypothetical protein
VGPDVVVEGVLAPGHYLPPTLSLTLNALTPNMGPIINTVVEHKEEVERTT